MVLGISRTHPDQIGVSDRGGRADRRLAPGDTFRGTVLEARAGGGILLMARGSKIPAYTARPLVEGKNYLFQVQSSGERLILRVMDTGHAKRSSAVRLWASGKHARAQLGGILETLSLRAEDRDLSRAVRDVLIRLRERMPAMLYRLPNDEGMRWLANQLRDSGLFLENRFALALLQGRRADLRTLGASDLKGMLFNVRAELGQGLIMDSTAADLANQVGRALQLIQQDQLLSFSSWKEGLGWFWFIPGHPEEGFRGGEVFIQKTDPGDEAFFLSLSLDFSLLGRMDVALSLHRSLINIRILTEGTETENLVNNHLCELREQFLKAGLEPGAMSCRRRSNEDSILSPFLEAPAISSAVDLVT